MVARHELVPEPSCVADAFSRDARPVLSISPGDEVVVETLDALGHLERPRFPGDDRPKMFPVFRGHCLAGPIEVEGARPGDVLAVHLRSVRPADWGFTMAGVHDTALNRHLGIDKRHWLLWEIDHAKGVARCDLGYEVGLRPFLGVIGLAPTEPGEHTTFPPRYCGGNLDCRELVAGTTLFLPVGVEGALLYLGDGHAAQGDGEVAGTAVECPMTTELVVDVVPEPVLEVLHATTPVGRITFGLSTSLDEAAAEALDAMVEWLHRHLGCQRVEATALASAAVDLRITQIVNQTFGVHAVWADDRLRAPAVTR
jgi:acetamidase/formamidase